MAFFKEFKEFALRGNMVDMAVGIILGLALGKVITSLVSDIIMPPIGFLIGGVDFSALTFVIKEGTTAATSVVIRYGAFINTLIDFVVVALAIFIIIKGMNRLTKNKK